MVVALLLASCGVWTPSEIGSGIAGTVSIGPSCPVESLDHPCPPRPIQALLRVLDPRGHEILEFETGPDGSFRVPLPAGTYTLRLVTPQGSPFPRGPDQELVVIAGRFTRVALTFDSGIR
ncbi:MAG: hypothetical protein ABSF61_08205 [Anaerolineales bacterium]|jgi:hypothetical protein